MRETVSRTRPHATACDAESVDFGTGSREKDRTATLEARQLEANFLAGLEARRQLQLVTTLSVSTDRTVHHLPIETVSVPVRSSAPLRRGNEDMGNLVRNRVAKLFREVPLIGKERERQFDKVSLRVRCSRRSCHASRDLETNGKKFRGEVRMVFAQLFPDSVRFPCDFSARFHAEVYSGSRPNAICLPNIYNSWAALWAR